MTLGMNELSIALESLSDDHRTESSPTPTPTSTSPSIREFNTPQNIIHDFGLTELLTIAPLDGTLAHMKHVIVKGPEDLEGIPKKTGGVYFIATDEPIYHSFNRKNHPKKLEGGFEIFYNGTADDLRERAKKHLLRTKSKGMSGVSMDILMDEEVESHTKCCFSQDKKKKTPFVNNERIKSIDDVYKLRLTEENRAYIRENPGKTLYFRNGINVSDAKHKDFTFRFYYQAIESHSVRDMIEIGWRKKNGIPKLCSYSEGR